MRSPSTSEVGPTQVVHFGLLGDEPGGMNQVVNEYISWNSEIDGVSISGQLTTRRKRDFASPFFMGLALVRVFRLAAMQRRRVAVVHLSEGGSFLREGGLLVVASLLQVPTLAHLHGATFASFARKHPRFVRAVLSRADCVASLTTESLDLVRGMTGPGATVRIIPNIVTVPEEFPTKQKRVLFGGQVSRRKGFDVLVDAWHALPRELLDTWQLHVAGPMHPDCADLPVAGIQMHGAVPHADVLRLQSTAAIACLPSRAEALPMFLLEAMSNRMAAVSTDVGQISDLLSDGAGIVVPAGDATALRSALAQLMTDDDVLFKTAGRGFDRVSSEYASREAKQRVVDVWIQVAH